jgi:hypothetical protein
VVDTPPSPPSFAELSEGSLVQLRTLAMCDPILARQLKEYDDSRRAAVEKDKITADQLGQALDALQEDSGPGLVSLFEDDNDFAPDDACSPLRKRRLSSESHQPQSPTRQLLFGPAKTLDIGPALPSVVTVGAVLANVSSTLAPSLKGDTIKALSWTEPVVKGKSVAFVLEEQQEIATDEEEQQQPVTVVQQQKKCDANPAPTKRLMTAAGKSPKPSTPARKGPASSILHCSSDMEEEEEEEEEEAPIVLDMDVEEELVCEDVESVIDADAVARCDLSASGQKFKFVLGGTEKPAVVPFVEFDADDKVVDSSSPMVISNSKSFKTAKSRASAVDVSLPCEECNEVATLVYGRVAHVRWTMHGRYVCDGCAHKAQCAADGTLTGRCEKCRRLCVVPVGDEDYSSCSASGMFLCNKCFEATDCMDAGNGQGPCSKDKNDKVICDHFAGHQLCYNHAGVSEPPFGKWFCYQCHARTEAGLERVSVKILGAPALEVVETPKSPERVDDEDVDMSKSVTVTASMPPRKMPKCEDCGRSDETAFGTRVEYGTAIYRAQYSFPVKCLDCAAAGASEGKRAATVDVAETGTTTPPSSKRSKLLDAVEEQQPTPKQGKLRLTGAQRLIADNLKEYRGTDISKFPGGSGQLLLPAVREVAALLGIYIPTRGRLGEDSDDDE